MIKAEYDREQCGISCTLKVHCKPLELNKIKIMELSIL